MTDHPAGDERDSSFELRARGKRTGLLRELWGFMREYRKWWLLPIVIVLLLLGVFVLLGNSAVAPFIYTLF
jgi:hypothetical protein